MSKKDRLKVRLLFVDGGSYHHEEMHLPAAALERYDRLIDCIREDEEVQKRVFVDTARLCSACVLEE